MSGINPPWKTALYVSVSIWLCVQWAVHLHEKAGSEKGGSTVEKELHCTDEAEYTDLDWNPAVRSNSASQSGQSGTEGMAYFLEMSCEGSSANKKPTLDMVIPRFWLSALETCRHLRSLPA